MTFASKPKTGGGGGAGTPGTAGTIWRTGAGGPSNATGVDNDQYLNTTTGDVYTRAGGVYTVTGNIRGTPGAAGTPGLITGFTGGNNNRLVYQTGATTVADVHPSMIDELNTKNLFWKDNTGQYWLPNSLITDAAGSNLTVGYVRVLQPQVVNNGPNYRDIDPAAAVPADLVATVNQDYVEYGKIVNATQWWFRVPQVDGLVLNPISRYDSFLVANYPRGSAVPAGRFLINQWTAFDNATPSFVTTQTQSTSYPHSVQLEFKGTSNYGTRVASDQITAQAADGQVQALLQKAGATGKYGVAMRVGGTSSTKNGVILTIDEDQPTATALQLISYNANTATTYTASFTFVHGSWYRFKLESEGTLIRGKVWLVTDTEPVDWMIQGISSYTGSGFFGITTNRDFVFVSSYSNVTNKGAEAALTGNT